MERIFDIILSSLALLVVSINVTFGCNLKSTGER